MEMLERLGLGEGGRLYNFILVDDEKVVNTELRFPDEFARHKILDLIGDFYLLNRPIRGKVTARLTGHTDNFRMMKKLYEEMKVDRHP
jgi:UDP-3-O-acyl-N-acetylglucosamine deacetylase